WGNPRAVLFIVRFASNATKVGWNGLLVGDMSQPRGGPMISGHTSHQVGLDADIWFTPMPNHVQSREEREFASATDIVATDLLDVDPEIWTHTYTELIRVAAEDPWVTRIFVNAAINKALCREAGADRGRVDKGGAGSGAAGAFPRPHRCPGDRPEGKAEPAPGRGRRLPRARLLVQGIDAAPAAALSGEAEAAADAGGPADDLQKD